MDGLHPEPWERRGLSAVLFGWLTHPAVLRPIFAVLRWFPPLRIGRFMVVSRHADVHEVLKRSEDFDFDPTFTERGERVNGAFVLGMDSSPQYRREVNLLREVIRPEDLPRIRDIVTRCADDVLDGARPVGRIDAVGCMARVVIVRLLAAYVGLTGPDEATLARWTGALINYVFLGIAPQAACCAGADLHRHLRWLIDQRRAAILSGQDVPDDVLTRLITLQGKDAPWLDDNAIARNLVGLAVAMVEESVKAVVHATYELLRRPAEQDLASRAAVAGDIDMVRQYAYEALRFRPVNPTVAPRRCRQRTTIGGRSVPEGTKVLVATLSAMFDRRGFARPRRFRADRPVGSYLHFSHGPRACLGRAINGVVIPELVAALLRLPNLRRARGLAGRLTYNGVVPMRLLLTFDPARDASPEPDRAVRQSVLSFVTAVQPAKVEVLTERLREIAKDPEGNPYIPLPKLEMLHFASLVLSTDKQGCFLVFESNFDGSLDDYLDALIEHADGLDDIYGCCAGYPWEGKDDPKRVKAYLRSHTVRPKAYHIGNTGRTVTQIKAEARLHKEIQGFIDQEQTAGRLPANPEAIRARIQEFVAGRGDLAWAIEPPLPRQTVRERLRHWSAFIGTVALAGPVLLALAPIWVPVLRRKESRDEPWQGQADHEHVAALLETEDLGGAQNHLTAIIPVKPGWFRRTLLRAVLYTVNLVARCFATKGKLSGIASIHFAHWSLLDGGRRLLFVSNYDGSWQSYLDDFIDMGSVGLTSIWSNTSRFPRTEFLVLGGARDGQRFKEWARHCQTPTNVFYCAYPDLTVANIDQDTAIRAGLSGHLSRAATREWLRSL